MEKPYLKIEKRYFNTIFLTQYIHRDNLVSLFVKNLWARRVFVEEECGSNPSLMLEDLADDILFWFTQTISKQIKLITYLISLFIFIILISFFLCYFLENIEPISFDYIERILRNEMYSLSMTVDATRNGITKEVYVIFFPNFIFYILSLLLNIGNFFTFFDSLTNIYINISMKLKSKNFLYQGSIVFELSIIPIVKFYL
jgi:hypothetical protein